MTRTAVTPRSRAVEAAPLPDALAAAQAVEPIAYALHVDNALRLALSPDEAAPLLGLRSRLVRDLCRSGALRARVVPPGSVNGRYLIPVSALIEYLAGRDDPIRTAS
jgi:hypothetical protein